jgi:TetR/AcrR family transcriptional regulator, tetracycline repressor protein
MAEKRAHLSRELITTTALDVVAREGLAALSMRRLAQELDVWPMSLYRHFRDKEDLLDAVAAAGAEDVVLPRGRGNPRAQLLELARQARELLGRQPDELRRRALTSPGLHRLSDAATRVLEDAGASPSDAALGWRAVLAYVVGSIELDAAIEGEADGFDAGLDRLLRGTISM